MVNGKALAMVKKSKQVENAKGKKAKWQKGKRAKSQKGKKPKGKKGKRAKKPKGKVPEVCASCGWSIELGSCVLAINLFCNFLVLVLVSLQTTHVLWVYNVYNSWVV